jgi:hypothetical protein
MPLPRIDTLLATDSEMQPVLAKAREINALAKLCKEFLPPELAALVASGQPPRGQACHPRGELLRGGQAQASFRVAERLLGEARGEG